MQTQKPVCSILTTLCSKYAALCCNFVFWMSTPSSLILYVKLPLNPNVQLNTTYCRGKSLYAAFWQLYAANMQHYAAIFCFFLSTPSRLICHVKLPLFPNFQLNTTYCKGKSLYAAFLQLYAANMQHYAAIFFFGRAPLLDWFIMWSHPYS